jgi:hypothetical protein
VRGSAREVPGRGALHGAATSSRRRWFSRRTASVRRPPPGEPHRAAPAPRAGGESNYVEWFLPCACARGGLRPCGDSCRREACAGIWGTNGGSHFLRNLRLCRVCFNSVSNYLKEGHYPPAKVGPFTGSAKLTCAGRRVAGASERVRYVSGSGWFRPWPIVRRALRFCFASPGVAATFRQTYTVRSSPQGGYVQ